LQIINRDPSTGCAGVAIWRASPSLCRRRTSSPGDAGSDPTALLASRRQLLFPGKRSLVDRCKLLVVQFPVQRFGVVQRTGSAGSSRSGNDMLIPLFVPTPSGETVSPDTPRARTDCACVMHPLFSCPKTSLEGGSQSELPVSFRYDIRHKHELERQFIQVEHERHVELFAQPCLRHSANSTDCCRVNVEHQADCLAGPVLPRTTNSGRIKTCCGVVSVPPR